MIKRTSLCAILIAACAPSLAGAPADWYRNVTIKYLYSGSAGNRTAFRVYEAVSVGTCASAEFTIESSNPHAKEMFAALLTAYVTQSPVNVYTNGACSSSGLTATDIAIGIAAPDI